MNKKLRQEVYDKFNGHCSYCGKEISMKDMQVDHMNPQRLGQMNLATNVNDISNLAPSCRRCNHYKRALTVDGFRESMLTLHERIAADYIAKVAIDYEIVTLKPFDGAFYFERTVPPFDGSIYTEKALSEYELMNTPRPIEAWGEDYGNCLWWVFPIVEPPYCGSPLDSEWPNYHTHFTRIPYPIDEVQP